MVNYKDVFRKIPKPVLFIKYELNKDKNTTMKIEFINDEALSFFNKTSDELIHKDFFDVLPEFKDDKNFINRIESIENDNIVCTKYIRSLVNFISITIQKIDEKYFAFYLEYCIEKKIFDEINELGNIFFIKDRENRYMYSSDLYNEYAGHPNLDMYGLTDFDVYSKENGDLYFNAAKTFIDSKQPYSKEISTLNNTVYILNRYSIYSNGEVIGIIGIFESVIGKLEKIYDGGIMTKIVNDSLEHIIFKDMNGVYLDCNDTFVIRVKDTGVGIPSDKLMYIFERFRQVENTFNKSTKGSGIGLSLVKDLIEIQGGTIEVKSELGVGSEFIIKLPVKILSDDSNIDKVYFNNDYHDLVKRMNIEFSDIYIGND